MASTPRDSGSGRRRPTSNRSPRRADRPGGHRASTQIGPAPGVDLARAGERYYPPATAYSMAELCPWSQLGVLRGTGPRTLEAARTWLGRRFRPSGQGPRPRVGAVRTQGTTARLWPASGPSLIVTSRPQRRNSRPGRDESARVADRTGPALGRPLSRSYPRSRRFVMPTGQPAPRSATTSPAPLSQLVGTPPSMPTTFSSAARPRPRRYPRPATICARAARSRLRGALGRVVRSRPL